MVFEFFLTFINETISLWLSMAPYLITGLFFAGLVHTFLGKDFIIRHLGNSRLGSVFKATIFGIPLPVCSCGVIPLVSSLKKEGASSSSALSFLVSTPTTGVDSIIATYSLMGPLFAVFRPLAAFISGIFVGTLNHFLNPEPENKAAEQHQHKKVPGKIRIKSVFHYAFIELAQDIGKWLVIGMLIGGFLTAALPVEFVEKFLAYQWMHFLIIMVISIPLYVCASGSIPIAAALIQKGFSPGAALVFLVAGPATNAVTLAFVRSELGKKAFNIYIISIITISAAIGLVFNWVWLKLGGSVDLIVPGESAFPEWLTVFAGLFLLALILNKWIPKSISGNRFDYMWLVKELSCKKCDLALKSRLSEIKGVSRVFIDHEKKTIGINSKLERAAIEQTIREAGYSPERFVNHYSKKGGST